MGGFARGLREDRPILIGIGAIWLVCIALLATQGINGLRPTSYWANFLIYSATALFFLVPLGALGLFRARPDHPIAYLKLAFAEHRIAQRFMRGLPMLLALVVFMPAFSAMKSAIPLFHPFSWDETFIAADQAIHGTDPWRILQPVLGHPWITAALAGAYHLWIMLIYAGGVFFNYLVPDRTLRQRYFIAYFGIWTIIGVGCAIALASVGPCFVEPIFGNRHFDEQMAYLYWANTRAPILVLEVQERLLFWQYTGSQGLARGITAMPSMHVSLALLFALAIGRHSRRLGWVFGAFFVVILVSSVHLGYHYAVDGYVSIVLTSAIWIAAGWLSRRSAARGEVRESAEARAA